MLFQLRQGRFRQRHEQTELVGTETQGGGRAAGSILRQGLQERPFRERRDEFGRGRGAVRQDKRLAFKSYGGGKAGVLVQRLGLRRRGDRTEEKDRALESLLVGR